MRFLTSLVVFGVMSTNLSFAGETDPANHVCPSLSVEGSKLVTNIQTIQASLKTGAECKPISQKLAEVNEVIANPNWKVFKGLLSGDDVESLEGEQIDELTSLASKASHSLVQTIAMLNGSGSDCVAPKDKPSFLGVLSGVTKEVSTLVGEATGPYGMAISLGGNIISSAIGGIDSFFKSTKSYNFYNKDEELLFINQFCSFVEAKKDVVDFVNMGERVRDLEYLDTYLGEKLSSIYGNCPECIAYEKAFKTKLKADKVIKRITSDIEIKQSVSGRTASTSRCVEIARAIHAPESDLEALMSIYDTYENPMMSKNDSSLIEYILESRSVLKEVFPSLSDCWRMNQKETEAISQKFNDFMRDDILHLNDTIFEQQLSTIKFIANKKYVEPLGDYTANSLERLIWAKKERLSVAKDLKDPNRENSLSQVRELHEKLENRISGFLMPQYLNFLVNKNKNSVKAFSRDIFNFKKNALREYSRKFDKKITSLVDLIELIKKSEDVDGRIILSKYRSTFDKLSIALSQRKTIDRYCEYLVYTSTISSRTQYICETRVNEITAKFKKLDKYTEEFKALAAYDSWANENLDVQSSRVRDYADMIRAWNSKGDGRWRTKAEAEKPKSLNIEERVELSELN